MTELTKLILLLKKDKGSAKKYQPTPCQDYFFLVDLYIATHSVMLPRSNMPLCINRLHLVPSATSKNARYKIIAKLITTNSVAKHPSIRLVILRFI